MANDLRENLIITELDEKIRIDSFHCERKELNKFLQEKALYNNQNLLSKIYAYINSKSENLVGFISLSAFRVNKTMKIADKPIYCMCNMSVLESLIL